MVFILNKEVDIHCLVEREKYEAIIVCSDIKMLVQISSFGYQGTLIFEVQSLGTPAETELILEDFKERINEHADALLYLLILT